MIKQERTMDEIDAKDPFGFLHDIALRHGFIEQFHIECHDRAVGIDTIHEHITDDKIFELIADNQLIGLVYLRRDDWNWTEATYIEIPCAIEQVKERLKKRRIEDTSLDSE
jgi:hypothetical protein